MIDYQEMLKRQQQGIVILESLQEDEKATLKRYCSLAADTILEMAKSRNAPTDEAIVNAFKNGVALGLQLMIEKGEIK